MLPPPPLFVPSFIVFMPRLQPLYNEELAVHKSARIGHLPFKAENEAPNSFLPKRIIRACIARHKTISKPKFKYGGRCNSFYCSHCVLSLKKGSLLLAENQNSLTSFQCNWCQACGVFAYVIRKVKIIMQNKQVS